MRESLPRGPFRIRTSPVERTPLHVGSRQILGPLGLGEDFQISEAGSWNIPRGLGYFLPWILVLPFPRAEFVDESDRRLVHGLGWGIAGSFLIVSLIPGSLPRYTMPLIAPLCWLRPAYCVRNDSTCHAGSNGEFSCIGLGRASTSFCCRAPRGGRALPSMRVVGDAAITVAAESENNRGADRRKRPSRRNSLPGESRFSALLFLCASSAVVRRPHR